MKQPGRLCTCDHSEELHAPIIGCMARQSPRIAFTFDAAERERRRQNPLFCSCREFRSAEDHYAI